jgi:hypothetical protein
MTRSIQGVLVGCLCISAAWLSQGMGHAQFRSNNFYVNQARLQGAQFSAYGQQLSAIQAGQVYGTNYGIPIYANSVSNYYNPYGSGYFPPYVPPVATPYSGINPYLATAPGYGTGTNPYSPVDPSLANPYSPYNPYNPYNPSYGAGSVLYGEADVIRASGQLVNSWEQARILREQALQAKLDTRKKEFDLNMYIKANTPTYTQEQEQVARITLRRIQTSSLPGEVSSGRSLNLLLDDLKKFPGKKISLEPLPLNEDILGHLNVTKTTFGMGLLRDNGKVAWPVEVQKVMTVMQQQNIDKQLRYLVKEANNDRIENNVIAEVQKEIERMREELVKKVNDIPTAPYLDAKRFLQDLYDSTRAIEKGEAINQLMFQRFIENSKGNRSVQEVADYMIKKGLRFGPAAATDEAAYRAVHSAMANYDIAMNSQLGVDSKE